MFLHHSSISVALRHQKAQRCSTGARTVEARGFIHRQKGSLLSRPITNVGRRRCAVSRWGDNYTNMDSMAFDACGKHLFTAVSWLPAVTKVVKRLNLHTASHSGGNAAPTVVVSFTTFLSSHPKIQTRVSCENWQLSAQEPALGSKKNELHIRD